jgi:hypothetical protein
MTRLIAAEFRKLFTTRLWLWLLLASLGYALACVAVSLAVALPWLAAGGIPVFLAGHGNPAVLAAVIISVALFGMTGAGLGALLGSEVITIAGLLYLYVAEPLLSYHRAGFLDGLPARRGRRRAQPGQPGGRAAAAALAGRPGVRRLGCRPRLRRYRHHHSQGHHLKRVTG